MARRPKLDRAGIVDLIENSVQIANVNSVNMPAYLGMAMPVMEKLISLIPPGFSGTRRGVETIDSWDIRPKFWDIGDR